MNNHLHPLELEVLLPYYTVFSSPIVVSHCVKISGQNRCVYSEKYIKCTSGGESCMLLLGKMRFGQCFLEL